MRRTRQSQKPLKMYAAVAYPHRNSMQMMMEKRLGCRRRRRCCCSCRKRLCCLCLAVPCHAAHYTIAEPYTHNRMVLYCAVLLYICPSLSCGAAARTHTHTQPRNIFCFLFSCCFFFLLDEIGPSARVQVYQRQALNMFGGE